MLYTTLNAIRKHGPCSSGWDKLLASLTPKQRAAMDRRLSLAQIIKSNGLKEWKRLERALLRAIA